MKKVLFIDRDGTLIHEPPDGQIDSLEKLEYIPGVFTWLGKLTQHGGFELVLVTNQDGLGTTRFPEETFWPTHEKMITALANEGIVFSAQHIDKSMPEENKPTRKPGIGMLTSYLSSDYDLKNSYVIGDRLTDLEMAVNLGCKGIRLSSELSTGSFPGVCLSSWKEIYNHILFSDRNVTVNRRTNETDINVNLNLDGTGESKIQTGIGFFDHMLEQVARHGQLTLNIITKGDLHIDEHHTIEDTALALGEAFRKALDNKIGIERYGFCLPMDDCLAQVALDFGGRPWLEWNVSFKREKIGEMPTEMFYHFFKSFSDQAQCNLNIKAEGDNEHHKIEAIFKAFARAIKMAKARNKNEVGVPSTKGNL
ncbi:MAG: bifunctional histidinol-phosphatase/imidazoleglycerol-phosphate dehydratase HisB [Cyclobacteriaceae bacterium]